MFKLIVNGKNGREESDFATVEQAENHLNSHLDHWGVGFTYEIVPFSARLEDISPRQIAYALLSIGITESQVIAAINQLPSPQKEQGVIAWNRSNYFVRTEPAVEMIGALMNLTSEQLDDIWKLGITL